ncbi:hypothetical protein A3Q56_08174 [Intoshia linei]|uniref:Uncharacterized protein n=1 Tax=Intoshia linei TaxID=1819745 RepID=A0A177ARP0_9BILA|nr:hypothetical protein A3Q56_08174 [Intoshia linei]
MPDISPKKYIDYANTGKVNDIQFNNHNTFSSTSNIQFAHFRFMNISDLSSCSNFEQCCEKFKLKEMFN